MTDDERLDQVGDIDPRHRAGLLAVLADVRAAERERIAGLFAGAAGRVKVRNASGERIDLISPELGDEIAAAIRAALPPS
jgi:hypothetical protein